MTEMRDETFDIPAELRSRFTGLQQRYGTVTPPPVGSTLSAFVPVGLANETRRSRLMKAIGAFIGTTVGKVVLGTTVAVASVGTGQAAGIIDVPGLSGDGPSPVAVEHSDETVGDDCVEHDDDGDDADQTSDQAAGAVDRDEACETDDVIDDDADDEVDDAVELQLEDELEAIDVDDIDDDIDDDVRPEQPVKVDQVNEVDTGHHDGDSDDDADHHEDESDDDGDDDSDHDEDESDDDGDDDSDHDEDDSDDDHDEDESDGSDHERGDRRDDDED